MSHHDFSKIDVGFPGQVWSLQVREAKSRSPVKRGPGRLLSECPAPRTGWAWGLRPDHSFGPSRPRLSLSRVGKRARNGLAPQGGPARDGPGGIERGERQQGLDNLQRLETLNRKNHYSNNNYKKMRQMSEQARDKNA